MRKIMIACMAAAAALLQQQAIAQSKSISGFTPQSAQAELSAEQKFDANLSAENIGSTIKDLSSKPHNLGSAGSKEVAENILARLKSYGFDAHIETFSVLFPTPKTRVLEMTSPTVYKALLKEPALKEDATSGQDGQLPTYNAWSADGDVTGELVFVNYGLPDDYEQLAKMGIDVKGKIVIAKYGRSWRGIKPKVAYEHGAIGCIIYSDPHDDGYTAGDVYPKGAFKNEYGVQRGSVMDMVIYPGDPLTPGIGATEDAKRLNRADAQTILKIPVLPISYHDAQPLLAALEGPVAPAGWAGTLPITYHVGPGKTTVHLKLEFDWKLVPCYDVIGMIKGAEFPDEWVVRGNHHDAWVNGAGDPISGQAAMLEEAKSIGVMVKNGWKPKRTLVYCAWDGEEPALLGSTEWAEEHADELQKKCVVYINSDGNGRGFLGAGGSHALTDMVDEVAKSVIDPQTNVTVFERDKAAEAVNAGSDAAKKEALNKKALELGALGSGSDFSSFLQHLGLPSLDIGYGGEDPGGEYHSIYDSYDDYSRFKDPGFHYGVALSQTAGRVALRMADADVLPFNFKDLYKAVDSYVNQLMALLQKTRENTEVENKLITSGDYKLAADPTKTFIVPTPKDEVPYLDFSPLQNALAALQKSTDSLTQLCAKAVTTGGNHDELNTKLYQAEQQLLLMNGLPRRPWYKHALYAPGFYTGYGVKTMPGVREAIEERNWKEAQEQINLDADVLNKLAAYLKGIM
ncbi:MAG TPA: M28 family metallopeptidase [Chitinophagaceae bacterium]|nr:M28 family metallopeptidase [Chitinophagaceae bacterium]